MKRSIFVSIYQPRNPNDKPRRVHGYMHDTLNSAIDGSKDGSGRISDQVLAIVELALEVSEKVVSVKQVA